MKTHINKILPLIALLAPILSAAAPGRFTITSKLDSTHLVMGKQTQVHVEVTGPIDDRSSISTIDTMWNKIEIVAMDKPTVKETVNGQKQMKQTVTIQSFEPGLYSVPPFLFAQDGDTVTSERPALKVLPVAADSLNNFENVVAVQGEFLPDGDNSGSNLIWWILLALAVVAAGILAYFKWFRKGNILELVKPAKKPLSPYELAVKRLNELHEEHLPERGSEKLYYTRLTDILRQYLDGRFGINAMEMTTTQIMEAVRINEITPELVSGIEFTLRTADFVKFAKVKPSQMENDKTFKTVTTFVEQTKPEEPESTEQPSADSEPTAENGKQEKN